MRQPRKLKKGEQGLLQLKTFIQEADHDWRYSSNSYKWYGIDKHIDSCLEMENDSFKRRYEMYGYNYDHDYAEGDISTYKRDGLYVCKSLTRIRRSGGGPLEISVGYTVIARGEDGRYSVMNVSPEKNEEGATILYIKKDIGLASEETLKMDLTRDIPHKYARDFTKACMAMEAIDLEEEKYIKEEKEKKRQEKLAEEAKKDKVEDDEQELE